MITGMNHTGFVVRDVEKATMFYRDVIGLTVVTTYEREGSPISQVVGYENAHLRVALLSIEEGHILELIQYVHPPGSERATEERSTLGGTHLAFNVEDIEQTFQQLVSNGVRGLNPPAEVAPGRKACYMQDPDGNWIELIEITE